jgi:hypothetical protein
LPSGSNLESVKINQIKPVLNDILEARSWARDLQKSKQIAYLIFESLSDVLWPFVYKSCCLIWFQ